MPPKVSINPETLKELYLESDLSERKCAKILGCSHTTITRALIEYKIPTKVYGSGKRKYTILPKDVLIKLYQERGLTISECADELGTQNNTIHFSLLKHDIPLRNPNHVPIYNISKEWLEQKHIKDGLTIKDCASLIGCTGHTIASELRRHRLKQIQPNFGGESNPNWHGGVSFGVYCIKFNAKFKEHIREKFNHKCYLCPKTEVENKRKLAIHHIDYNKNSICNGKEWAFVPLCHKCHSRTNGPRWYWFNLLINYWAMNPEINFCAEIYDGRL